MQSELQPSILYFTWATNAQIRKKKWWGGKNEMHSTPFEIEHFFFLLHYSENLDQKSPAWIFGTEKQTNMRAEAHLLSGCL